MKRKLKLLSVCLLIPLISFGQTISKDTGLIMTPQQLRTTNLIFLEHEKWSKQIPLLKQQIRNYQKLDSLASKHDSLQVQQLVDLNNTIDLQERKIKKLKRTKSFGMGVIVALVLGLICKQ